MTTEAETELPEWMTGDVLPEQPPTPPQEAEDGPADLHGLNPSFQSFVDWLAAKADGDDTDTMGALVDLVEQMATADSPAAVLASGYPLHAEEVAGRPLGVYGVTIRAGEYEENDQLGFYAVMDVELLDTSQRRWVTCGGKRVMAKLYGLDVRGAWPMAMMITATETKGGKRRFDLRAVE